MFFEVPPAPSPNFYEFRKQFAFYHVDKAIKKIGESDPIIRNTYSTYQQALAPNQTFTKTTEFEYSSGADLKSGSLFSNARFYEIKQNLTLDAVKLRWSNTLTYNYYSFGYTKPIKADAGHFTLGLSKSID